ncbi:protein of unknown function [Pseudomonas inefficax]|uniref:Uncharacterized protein n=1 Tax=Pseudomonas inefficax TaxID=2078786 RepID=A0AAQ1STR4_9PSED|nr:protein of unknown function [Pseudomonas inefficax]
MPGRVDHGRCFHCLVPRSRHHGLRPSMAFCPFLGLEQRVCQPKHEEYVSKQILVALDVR